MRFSAEILVSTLYSRVVSFAFILLLFSLPYVAVSQSLTPLPLKLRVAFQKYGSVQDFAWFNNNHVVLRTESGLIFSNGQDSFTFSAIEPLDQRLLQVSASSVSSPWSVATLKDRALIVSGARILGFSPNGVQPLTKLNSQLEACSNHRIFSQGNHVWVQSDCGTEVFHSVGENLESRMVLAAGHFPVFDSPISEGFFVIGPRSIELYGLTSTGFKPTGVRFQSRNRLLGAVRSTLGLLIWTSKSMQILDPKSLVRTDHISLESPVGLKEVLVLEGAFVFRLADKSIFKADQASGTKLSSRIRLDDLSLLKVSPDGTRIGVLVGQSFKYLSYLSNDKG